MPEAGKMSKKSNNKYTGAKPNYLYTIISMALILFVMGLLSLVILQGNQLIDTIKSNVIVLVEIEEGTNQRAIDSLEMALKTMDFIQPNSLKFVSKEQIAREMESEMEEDLKVLSMENPFLNMFNFNPRPDYIRSDSLKSIQQQIMQLQYVKGAYYKGNLVEKISKNIKKLTFIALGLSLFFIFVALILIHNTIRLALYANRILIKNMQLVGATWGFISRPYLWRAVGYGLLSSVIALGGLYLMYKITAYQLPQLYISARQVLYLALALTTLGVAISTISTYFVVRKYLRANIDDLY